MPVTDLLSLAEELDRTLFVWINSTLAASPLDPVMRLLREPLAWSPLYAGLLIWAYRKMPAQCWWFLLLTIGLVALTDFSSSKLLKPWFGRLRPCYEPELVHSIRSLVGCGGKNSLPSNHAANHFALAIFWFRSIRAATGKQARWLWYWAFMIGYAQVYVGKHYPGDILAGAVWGLFAGWIFSVAFQYYCITRKPGKNPGPLTTGQTDGA